MGKASSSYVEHVAIRVTDIQWHIDFFREVLGMSLREVEGSPESPRQVWTIGGLQFIRDPSYRGPEGRLAHLGIMTEDLELALENAYAHGVKELPQGRNWVELPGGLALELIQARNDAVAQALAIDPRA
jgi:catechol 2,3-dioxygenase-like lactoylglutathione lyase family enzyme